MLHCEIVDVLCTVYAMYNNCLKVGGNEKNGGSGRSQMLDNGLGPWRSRFFFSLNMQFLSKMSYFRFACDRKMNRQLLCN